MLEFSTRHEADLEAYFSGAFACAMGLRSNTGALLERAAGAAQSEYTRPIEWSGRGPIPDQVITCRESDSGARRESTEAAESALEAVQIERRIRSAMTRLSREEARALRAWYTPAPPDAFSGELAIVAESIGTDRVRVLVLMATTKPAKETPAHHREPLLAQRAGAKAELSAQRQQARRLLERAKESYANAERLARREEREARAARFARGLR